MAPPLGALSAGWFTPRPTRRRCTLECDHGNALPPVTTDCSGGRADCIHSLLNVSHASQAGKLETYAQFVSVTNALRRKGVNHPGRGTHHTELGRHCGSVLVNSLNKTMQLQLTKTVVTCRSMVGPSTSVSVLV